MTDFGNRQREAGPDSFRPEGFRKAGPVLFIAIFLFLWVTISPYHDLANPPPAGSSNPLNQISIILLTGLMGLFALSHPLRSQICQPRLLLIALFGWFLLCSAVSSYPADAMKKTVLAAMVCVNAGVFLLLPHSRRQFTFLLLLGAGTALGFAYFGVIFLPKISIHQATEMAEPFHAGFWRGQYAHKNEAAAVMLISTFFGLYIRSAGWKRTGTIIAIASVAFLLRTGGKSSTAMLPAILVIQWAFERFRWTRLPIAVGGVATFNFIALGAATSEGFRSFIKSLGVDPTFTNRTEIWKIAFDAVAQSPVFGYGFQGFWMTADITNSDAGLETWAVNAFNGHNAYVDTLLTTGFPGLVLTLILLFVVPLRAVRALDETGNDPALSRLFMRVWLYGLYAACLESLFFQSGSPVWFIMLVSVFGLWMQSSLQLVGAPARPSFSHGNRYA